MKDIEIDVESVKAKLDAGETFLLLDCREPAEFETVSIESATLIPMGQLSERIGELGDDKGREVVVYCHHGGRSLMVAEWLRGQGFQDAQSMAGGVDQWAVRIDTNCRRY